MQRRTVMLAIAALTTTALACLWPTDASDLQDPAVLVSPQAPVTTTLALTADTYLRQGEPNQNFGTEPILRVRPTGKNRALLQVDPAALAAAVGGAPVTAARLELTITHNADNWGATGREIALHRLTVPWTELGATWNCGVDTVPGNPQAECAAGTAWEMGPAGPNPWVATPTATATITNGLTGVVTFEVTADVAAWLSGTLNAGWILKRVDEGPSGAVEFGARESASPPVLLLTITADAGRPPIPDGFVTPETILLVSPPGNDSVLVLRNHINIAFDDTTSGSTIATVFAKYGAQVAGGDSVLGIYIVQVPDPGPAYTALDSLLSRVRNEPGVRYAFRYVFSEPVRDPGRFPNDDPQQMLRPDWLGAPTDGTRALRAIRAPLAWGCETGLYGSATVAVGLIDDVFETSLPDLQPSFSPSNLYPASLAQPLDTVVTLTAGSLSHGTAIAGVLSARGDNGVDVAGLTWQSQLHLFRLAREDGGVTKRVTERGKAIARAIRIASSTDARILHSSVEAEADSVIARLIADEIANFVNAAPGRLFVQGGQNFRYTIRADTALRILRGGFAMHQAMAVLDITARQRVLFVGAANGVGSDIWNPSGGPNDSGATLMTGITDVMAPAEDILLLVRPQDFGVSVRSGSGTSFAAPMVAGTAVLLWAFDSTLTADDVKRYIVDGARQRVGPDGTLVDSPVIPNSGDLNLLDAYEALAKASRERPGTTPICGGQVWARDAAIYVDQGAGTPLRTLPIPGATFLALPSLAQGGRALAVTNFSLFGDTIEAWTVNTRAPYATTILPGVYARQYLERGTADLKLVDDPAGFGLRLTLRGTGTDLTDVRLESLVVPPGATGTAEIVRVSPLGDLAAVHSHVDLPTFASINRWDLVRLTDPPQLVGAPIAFLQSPQEPACTTNCPVFAGDVAWSHDSRRGIFALWRMDLLGDEITAVSTRLVSAESSDGPVALDSGVVAGAWLLHPLFTVDDSLLVAEHPGLVSGDIGPPCQERRREPGAPFADRVGAAREALLADFCSPFSDGPGIFTAPPAVAAGGWAGARSSVLGHLRSRAATRGLATHASLRPAGTADPARNTSSGAPRR